MLILGGGEATRLPGKLELAAGGVPMIVRVFRNLSAERETAIACKGSFARAIDDALTAPMVVDRWSLRGPLAGMLTTMAQMRSRFVFAVAGDAPFVDAAFVERLERERLPGDEAVVPVHESDGREQLEPLAALYDRLAFLREGLPVLRSGRGALRLVIDRLRARMVRVDDARIFANVNTQAEYEAIRPQLLETEREHLERD